MLPRVALPHFVKNNCREMHGGGDLCGRDGEATAGCERTSAPRRVSPEGGRQALPPESIFAFAANREEKLSRFGFLSRWISILRGVLKIKIPTQKRHWNRLG